MGVFSGTSCCGQFGAVMRRNSWLNFLLCEALGCDLWSTASCACDDPTKEEIASLSQAIVHGSSNNVGVTQRRWCTFLVRAHGSIPIGRSKQGGDCSGCVMSGRCYDVRKFVAHNTTIDWQPMKGGHNIRAREKVAEYTKFQRTLWSTVCVPTCRTYYESPRTHYTCRT